MRVLPFISRNSEWTIDTSCILQHPWEFGGRQGISLYRQTGNLGKVSKLLGLLFQVKIDTERKNDSRFVRDNILCYFQKRCQRHELDFDSCCVFLRSNLVPAWPPFFYQPLSKVTCLYPVCARPCLKRNDMQIDRRVRSF